MNKKFDSKSPFFIGSILTVLFTVLAALGLEFPKDPATMSTEITNLFQGGSIYAVFLAMLTLIITPVWSFVKSKKKLTWSNVFSSTSTIISIVSLIFLAAVYFGIKIPTPDETAVTVVTAIYARDWGTLITVAITAILNPLIRWIKDRKTVTAG